MSVSGRASSGFHSICLGIIIVWVPLESVANPSTFAASDLLFDMDLWIGFLVGFVFGRDPLLGICIERA